MELCTLGGSLFSSAGGRACGDPIPIGAVPVAGHRLEGGECRSGECQSKEEESGDAKRLSKFGDGVGAAGMRNDKAGGTGSECSGVFPVGG